MTIVLGEPFCVGHMVSHVVKPTTWGVKSAAGNKTTSTISALTYSKPSHITYYSNCSSHVNSQFICEHVVSSNQILMKAHFFKIEMRCMELFTKLILKLLNI